MVYWDCRVAKTEESYLNLNWGCGAGKQIYRIWEGDGNHIFKDNKSYNIITSYQKSILNNK